MIVLNVTRTIGEHKEFVIHGEIGFQLVEDGFDPVSLINFGQIHVANSAPASYAEGIDLFDGWSWPGAAIVNHASGSIWVKATGSGSGAVGIASSGQAPAIDNRGLMKVQSTHSNATGVSVYQGFDLTNSGSVVVKALEGHAYGASAIYEGGLLNTGLIKVSGATADGIRTDYFGLTTFENTGRIAVHDETAARESVAVAFGNPVLHRTYINDGVIRADWAFVEATGWGAGVEIDNSGVIRGSIQLGDSADQLVNTGVLRGALRLGDGGDRFDGSAGRLFGHVVGGSGNDVLIAGRDADRMWGDSLVNQKGAGADTLCGGRGGDELHGGDGADTFLFTAVADSHGRHVDVLADLSDQDLIDISAIDADITTGGDQAFAVVSALSGHAGELTLQYDILLGDTWLEGDVDGDGAADLVVRLSGAHTSFHGFIL